MFMRLIIAAFLLILSFGQSLAQKDYLITTELDTLKGKVAIQLGGKYDVDRVRIKTEKEKLLLESYRVKEIHDGDKLYKTIKLSGRYQFVEVEREGTFLSYYRFVDLSDESNTQYNGRLLMTKDGRQHMVNNIGFKKKIVEFLTDCESVTGKIESGEYGRNDLDKIMDEYNACIDAKSSAEQEKIEFAKEASKIDLLIESVHDMDVEGKEELLDMLRDVKSKLEAGENVPGYLQSAIRAKLEGEDSLLRVFDEAVSQD